MPENEILGVFNMANIDAASSSDSTTAGGVTPRPVPPLLALFSLITNPPRDVGTYETRLRDMDGVVGVPGLCFELFHIERKSKKT